MILRASYGRFHQGVLTGEVSQNHPALTPITTMAYDAATGGYTTLISVVDPKINLFVDPKTRSPRTDEYAIGVDRELGRRLSASVAFIHKTGTDAISWVDVGGQYRDETRTMPDGRIVPVRVLANSTAARRFLATNPDGYFMRYNGLSDRGRKATLRRLAGVRLIHLFNSVRTAVQQRDKPRWGTAQHHCECHPNHIRSGQKPLTNARGRLPNDRPHVFRVMGKADVLRTGVSIDANLQQFSGKPWAASALIPLPQGDRRILLEPRGSRRLSSQSLLDMRVSKTILTRESARIELRSTCLTC
jgi:hypothetical protein